MLFAVDAEAFFHSLGWTLSLLVVGSLLILCGHLGLVFSEILRRRATSKQDSDQQEEPLFLWFDCEKQIVRVNVASIRTILVEDCEDGMVRLCITHLDGDSQVYQDVDFTSFHVKGFNCGR